MSTDVQTVDTGLDKQSRRRSKDTEKAHRRSSNFQNKRYKHDHKFRKKTAANGKFPPYKKRNKDFIIPPTKFLLGGNITDPLNLNSLQDEDINRAMNAVTPKSSPLPTPKHRKGEIEVIIPPDITDPLNLTACDDDATYEAMLTSPIKKTAKKQKKNKKRRSHRTSSGPGSGKEDTIEGAKLDQDPSPLSEENKESQEESMKEAKPHDETKDVKDTPTGPAPAKRHKSDHNNRANLRKIELKERKADLDKIVSPVIPQPGTWTDRHRFRPPQRTPQIDQSQAKKLPKFKDSDAKFQYGNYSRYYGYRNPNHGSDVRFRVFEKHKQLFEGKDVLDIGCNTGHLTLAIARDFHPNRVVGMDIDRSLIAAARSNIRHYVNCGKEDKFFPVSMPIVYGPIEIPGVNEEKGFPHNISFVQGNYVLESDVLLSLEQPQFDVILCLSITKWIQLNWGDAGLKRAFKRMFAQLRPGGVLILEAQSWSSYKRKRNLTPETWKNYHAVELFPHHFTEYLLNEVGFSKCEVMGAPLHQSRGFQRPIKMFIKEDPSFDTPRPLGYNTERFESYSFRLPDSVHCPDDFSGDSNFPYETPNSFNSPESGFSEGLHPRRYPVMRLGLPLDEAEGGADGAGMSGEWRPKSAGESTVLSVDSGSQGAAEETTTSHDSEQEELRGTSGNLEVNEMVESRPTKSEPENCIEKAETSEQPVTLQEMEEEQEVSDSDKIDKIEECESKENIVLQSTVSSVDSGSQGATEERTTSHDSEQEELRGTRGNLEVNEMMESRPKENELEHCIEKVETSEQPVILQEVEKEQEVSDSGKVDKIEECETKENIVLQSTVLSVDSGSQGAAEEKATSHNSEQEELRGTCGNLEVNEMVKSRPKENEPEHHIKKVETSEQPVILKEIEKEQEKIKECKTEGNVVLQRFPCDKEDHDTESQETKEVIGITTKVDEKNDSNASDTGVNSTDSQ